MTKQNIWPIALLVLLIIVIILWVKLYFYPTVETVVETVQSAEEQIQDGIDNANFYIIASELLADRMRRKVKEMSALQEEDGSQSMRTRDPRQYIQVNCPDDITNPIDCEYKIKKNKKESVDTWVVSTGYDVGEIIEE